MWGYREHIESIMDEDGCHEHLPSPPRSSQAPLVRHISPVTTTSMSTATDTYIANTKMDTYNKNNPVETAPVYIPEDVVLPPEFELRESCIIEAGLGVFSLVDIPIGERFGPFAGIERLSVKDTQCAWEIVDEVGKVRCWIDASEPGSGNWMKYVRSAPTFEDQNMVAVQIDNKVFYKVIRTIPPGAELLVLKEAAFPDQDGVPIQLIEEKQFPCCDCAEFFRSKVALRRHQKYACKNTNTIFTTLTQQFHKAHAANLSCDRNDTHTKSEGDSSERNACQSTEEERDGSEYRASRDYSCDSCPKSFHWKSNLLRHQNEHDDDHQFPCEHCDKTFSDPSNLQRHIRTQHVGARCHACPECGKTFATSSGLKQHTHIHSSIKPFICDVCLKSYTQFSNLCRHKRMHADCRTQLKCNNCCQMFATVTSLNKHRRFCHGSQILNTAIPVSQANPGMQPIQPMRNANVVTPNPALMGVGMLGTNNPLHPANLAHLWNANLHLTQQALLQNNLLGSYPDKGPLPSHHYFLGYPPISAQSPILSGGSIGKPNSSSRTVGSRENSPVGSANSSEDWIKHYTASNFSHGKSVFKPTSSGQLMKTTQEFRKHDKAESEVSDGSDLSNVSTPTGSDLDSTSGSDLDSDSEETRGNKAHCKTAYHHATNWAIKQEQPQPADRRESRRPESHRITASEPMKAIASIAEKYFGGAHPGGREFRNDSRAVASGPIQRDSFPNHQETPFDFSKGRIGPARQPSGEEPLDLSMPRRKRMPNVSSEPMKKTRLHSPSDYRGRMAEPAKNAGDLYAKPTPLVMPDPIYRVNGDALPNKFMRMDYTPLFPNTAFQNFRKFDHYHSEKVLAKTGLSQQSHRGYAGGVVYPTGGDKMVMRSKDRYTCKYCGKLFPRSANLTRHLRTHTGEQPYSCKYCDRSFSISSNLQRHVRNIHNKEKPFKCPLCERCFGQQTNLDRHLKKHENERAEEIADEIAAEHEVMMTARLMAKTKALKEPNDLNEKDESYFDEIKNFIDDAKEKEALRRKLIELEASTAATVVTSKQVQSPSVCSSSTEVKEEEEAQMEKMPKETKPQLSDNDEEDDEEDDLEEDKEMEYTIQEDAVLSKEDLDKSTLHQDPDKQHLFINQEDRMSQDEDTYDSMNDSDALTEGDKSQNVTSEEDAPMHRDNSDPQADFGKSHSVFPTDAADLPDVDILREGRTNLSRHSKLQAYSLMMAFSDEETRRGEGPRRSLHPAHHTPVHTATPV